MFLDRELQNKILTSAANEHPSWADIDCLVDEVTGLTKQKLASNLRYLEQHGLIEPDSFSLSMDDCYQFNGVKITHKGQDFLSDDGGLSAILNVVTVKFETQQLREILQRGIDNAQPPLSHEDKSQLTAALQSLPGESIKHLTTKLLDAAVEQSPTMLAIIGTYLGLSG